MSFTIRISGEFTCAQCGTPFSPPEEAVEDNVFVCENCGDALGTSFDLKTSAETAALEWLEGVFVKNGFKPS
jgi:hypothetical protein